jgi:hypothetical protein
VDFEFSHDEKYLTIRCMGNKFYFCYFENGFENDLFLEREIGQHSLDKMSSTMFVFDTAVRGFGLSSLNHLFLNCQVNGDSYSLYKSKLTVKELMN